ncbi:MAG: glycogen debranching N-terminal domain-containing protein [Kineosporiaceae bacterium]
MVHSSLASDGVAAPGGAVTAPQQPWLHDLVPVLRAPTQVWSDSAGQVDGEGATGYYHADVRVLRCAVMEIAGAAPIPIGHHLAAVDDVVFVGLVREHTDFGADPTVRTERRRRVQAGRVVETVEIRSWAATDLTLPVRVRLACDLARIDDVKAGVAVPDRPPRAHGPDAMSWADDAVTVELSATDAQVTLAGSTAEIVWEVSVPSGGRASVGWTIRAEAPRSTLRGADSPASCQVAVRGSDHRWTGVLHQAMSDVEGMRMSLAQTSGHDFVAAGAPWFLTLFGRDSLWSARMLLPFGTALAGSTLRALASLQGQRVAADTVEAPGKILHEVRAGDFAIGALPGDLAGRSLPPVYYGAIDATPLWVCTLHDAWRWGLPAEEVAELLPAAERALEWLVTYGDGDGDGFLEYRDETGSGLANQGWKDSGDGIRHVDGTPARAPLALCEVQGYAYAAARAGADLLDAHGRDGGAELRAWSDRLRTAFHEAYWVEDDAGPYPAVALDRDKRPVGSLTSNIGHLLGTGLLDERQSAVVARRLAAPDMFSGFGIRTLSSAAAGFSPVGYHVGAVWPHDTAITVGGMAAAELPEAGPVADGLLEAMHVFGGRPPELFAGDSRDSHPIPLPYPASCRPQAWSSAAAAALLAAVLGLRPRDGRPTAHPVRPWAFGEMTVHGVRVGANAFTVEIDAGGGAVVEPAA